MARKTTKTPFTSQTLTHSKSKPKSSKKLNPTELYTYLPSLPKRHRTSAQTLSLSREESAAHEKDVRRGGKGKKRDEEDDGEEKMKDRIAKVAMMIASEETGVVEDESEVESDDAWDEGDEDRWGDMLRDMRGKSGDGRSGKGEKGDKKEEKRKRVKPIEVNLDSDDEQQLDDSEMEDEGSDEEYDFEQDEEEVDENEEEEEDEDEDEEPTKVSVPRKPKVTFQDDVVDEVSDQVDDESAMEDDSEGEDSSQVSDPSLPSDISDDEDDPSQLASLNAFVDSLTSVDPSMTEGKTSSDASKIKPKRRLLPSLPSTSSAPLSGKLDLSSLVSSHPSLSSSTAALLKKDKNITTTSILKSGVVSAPLPTVVKERLDREAAYEQTRQEGYKWSGVMRRIKQADHLSFPLQASDRGGVKTPGQVLASFKPETKLESAIQNLLDKANLTDKSMEKQEDEMLKGQEMTLEEIAERRQNLRHQRELMFRAESRAKRVAKIKSKTFRKLARKREGKLSSQIEVDEEEQREKLERLRAKERATLRHGAQTKWAKGVGGAGEVEDRRKAKEEMLDLKERLKSKIMGGDHSDSSSDDDDNDNDEQEEGIKRKAFDQLDKLDEKENDEEQGGLLGMAFMKKAQERRLRLAREEEEGLKRDIEMFGRDGDGEDQDEDEDEEMGQVWKQGEGRMTFAGPTVTSTSKSDSTSIPTSASTTLPDVSTLPSKPSIPFTEHNPWLSNTSLIGPSKKRNVLSGSEDKGTKRQRKLDKEAKEMEDETVEIDLNFIRSIPLHQKAGGVHGSSKSTTGPKSLSTVSVDGLREESTEGIVQTNAGFGQNRAKNVSTSTVRAGDDDKRKTGKSNKKSNDGTGTNEKNKELEEETESETEDEDEQDLLPINDNSVKPFKQRDLVAEAFAGDNVLEEFQSEKEKQIELDGPKVEDTSLPGWGSWSGRGLKKRTTTNPKFLITKPGISPNQRKDFSRSNVIITERTEKKSQGFLTKDLPFPYTNTGQYEASFSVPVGSEWNSRKVYQRETMPRVVKKPGAIIEPIRRLF
ncbi:hypothetical protein M231_02770 [Tremella mesenterica]|uniref:U3 small nucleolar RNA-associated protein 14 n=1 Tax=Tremella mesenterica TaxID=5217 RepID=A0A4Q1BPX3_TREME|nr:uncharacterized protein TREMEDRAFT_62025 [Tremella mesenterica DSM 1558]EIW70264.1 hypothetical protein TREMEDRAFT_62025 [Tremella mesenterica DSM 1558]RXK39975.1 hypothetical protein M231_02770 [Tremella mesenterica]